MTQSSPIRAPAPIATFGCTIVRAPIAAPAPTVTNGPIDTSAPIAASPATALIGSTPAGGRVSGANSADDVGERRVRIVGVQDGAAHARRIAFRRSQNHRRCARRRQLGQVAGVRDEREIARSGLVDGRDADDVHVAVTLEAALQSIRNVP